MMYSLTIFKSLFDNKTDKRVDLKDWQAFESMLYKLSTMPGYKAKRGENKKSSPLISPAVYQPDTTRANRNVIEWAGWAAIDVDDHKFEGDLENELRKRFGSWYYVCYSTASSSNTLPKFRLVFPLTTSVPASKIRHFWYALNTELDSIGDRQTKDLSRMYYVPAKYPGANNFIFSNHGSFIDPDELMSRHEYTEKQVIGNSFFDRLPEELQSKVIAHRRNQLVNTTNIKWNSYRDCPFVNKKLIADYMTISETGWYAKMYQFMVSVAANAIKQQYPITSVEIATLCKELDADTGNWYQNRPLKLESERAIEYAYRNV
jgi:hypothetical protein